MKQICVNPWCSQSFEITDEDLAFYDKVSPVFPSTALGASGGKKYLIPPPKRCPECRRQRRLSYKNFHRIYRRRCSKTDQAIISMFCENVPFPVYDLAAWWKDDWHPKDYGLPVDITQPFFSQFDALCRRVPHPSNVVVQSENSEYCNYCFESKNSYLVSGCVKNEDCCYGHIVWQSNTCFDCLYCYRCELCYECVSCTEGYKLFFSIDAENCSESQWLEDCIGCTSCFGCVGLRNKQYHIFNTPYPQKEYVNFLRTQTMKSEEIIERMATLRPTHIVKAAHQLGCEKVTGDYLLNCKNIHCAFDLKNCEDCKYCSTLDNFKDAADCDYAAIKTELAFNTMTCYGFGILCSANCMSIGAHLLYCESCFSCKHCFGCCCLRNSEYCILNQQYTQEEYEHLVPKIIGQMQVDGEWGEFFTPAISPFGYNETIAQEYFPLTKKQVLERGFRWNDYEASLPKVEKSIKAADLPDTIDEIPDDILNWAIECDVSRRPFRIIKQELDFYRNMRLPVSRHHPEERHRRRMALRNPRKLWKRSCAECQQMIETTYAPDRPEKVVCETCYLKEVY